MSIFEGWSRQELLSLAGTVVAGLATIIGLVLTRMVKTIHVVINSRMAQLLTGAKAEGAIQERRDADARAKEKREETS